MPEPDPAALTVRNRNRRYAAHLAGGTAATGIAIAAVLTGTPGALIPLAIIGAAHTVADLLTGWWRWRDAKRATPEANLEPGPTRCE